MSRWHKDWLITLCSLLNKKEGYEIVRTLLVAENNKRVESDIAYETGGSESTVEEWLQEAEDKGMVESGAKGSSSGLVREWKLYESRIPPEMKPLIKTRGRKRRGGSDVHADVAGYSQWQTGPSISDILLQDPDEDGYIELDKNDFSGS
jgi:predicted transcriptional regulator